MDLDDHVTFATPEGIELQLDLAGLGSRFLAQLIDLLIFFAILASAAIVVAAVGGFSGDAGNLIGGLFILLTFVLFYAYNVVFEVLNYGRTPGKSMNGLRVVGADGQPVSFAKSLVRNLMRLIDGLPFLYIPGTISILATKQNQRLGDLSAGTLVVRDEDLETKAVRRRAARDLRARQGAAASASWSQNSQAPLPDALTPPPGATSALAAPAAGAAPSGGGWDTTAVTAEDLAAVSHFLERRAELTQDQRAHLADQLAFSLRQKVRGVDPLLSPEPFLELLVGAKLAVNVSDWDVSAVTAQEIAAVRSFLTRRADVTPQARTQLADQMATALRPRVAGADGSLSPEAFLEALSAAKAARR